MKVKQMTNVILSGRCVLGGGKLTVTQEVVEAIRETADAATVEQITTSRFIDGVQITIRHDELTQENYAHVVERHFQYYVTQKQLLQHQEELTA